MLTFLNYINVDKSKVDNKLIKKPIVHPKKGFLAISHYYHHIIGKDILGFDESLPKIGSILLGFKILNFNFIMNTLACNHLNL